jgi:hypothetical protein
VALIPVDLQARGLKMGLDALFPGNAVLTERAGGFIVRPDAQQAAAMRSFIERKISTSSPKGQPGTKDGERGVKLDLSDVYWPVVLKRVVPVAVGLLIVGYLVGKAT